MGKLWGKYITTASVRRHRLTYNTCSFRYPVAPAQTKICTTTTPAWRMDDRADAVNNGPRPRLRLGGMASIPFGDWKREKSGSADWGAGMNKLWERLSGKLWLGRLSGLAAIFLCVPVCAANSAHLPPQPFNTKCR